MNVYVVTVVIIVLQEPRKETQLLDIIRMTSRGFSGSKEL